MSRSPTSRVLDQRDLLIVIVAAVAATVGVALGLHPIVRSGLAIPLMLVLPGYGLASALFPSRELPAVERLLVAIGSSIGIAVLTGLALVTTGLGLSGPSWAIALGTTSVIGAGVAWWRRTRRGIKGPRPGAATMPRMGVLMMVVATLAVVNVLLGSQLIASGQQSPAPAALWLVPLEGDPSQARLGVRSGTSTDGQQEYRVRLSSEGAVLQEYELELDDEETWETIVAFSPDVRARPVVARLYEGASESEIRYVVIQPTIDGV